MNNAKRCTSDSPPVVVGLVGVEKIDEFAENLLRVDLDSALSWAPFAPGGRSASDTPDQAQVS